MLANQPPYLVCIRPNVSLEFQGFRFGNQKLETAFSSFRIAIPAPRREAQEELNTLTESLRSEVSGFETRN
jgi:hypothetical protein